MVRIKATDLQIVYDEQQKEEKKGREVIALIAELGEAAAQRDIENKLAIAELAEAMTRGK